MEPEKFRAPGRLWVLSSYVWLVLAFAIAAYLKANEPLEQCDDLGCWDISVFGYFWMVVLLSAPLVALVNIVGLARFLRGGGQASDTVSGLAIIQLLWSVPACLGFLMLLIRN
jgi:hypothetical protein